MRKIALISVFALTLAALLAMSLAGCETPARYEIVAVTDGAEKILTTDGSALEMPDAAKTGYVFLGWETEDGKEFIAEEWLERKEKSDARVTAKYRPIRYTIEFEPNGGRGAMDRLELEYDRECLLPTGKFERRGMRSRNWDMNGARISGGATVKNLTSEQGKNIVLRAIWEPDIFAVTFDPNGGEIEPRAIGGFAYGKDYDVSSAVPRRKGYAFRGWRFDDAARTPFNAIGTWMLSENAKVAAVWAPEEYEATFECATKHENPEGTYTLEREKFALKDPEDRPGYRFVGWFDENGEKIEEIFGGMTGDIKLRAEWEPTEAGSADITYALSVDGTFYSATGRTGRGDDLVIPSEHDGLPVREIAKEAFCGEKRPKRAVLPETIEKIGEKAFYGNGAWAVNRLEEINIPAATSETIGEILGFNVGTARIDSAFVAKNGLNELKKCEAKDIYVKIGLETQEPEEREGYIRMTQEIDPAPKEGYAHWARPDAGTADGIKYKLRLADESLDFDYAEVVGLDESVEPEKLRNIEIPESATFFGREFRVAKIGSGAFSHESAPLQDIDRRIESVSIPTGATRIGYGAFEDCKALKRIEIPENGALNRIEDYAFRNCSALEAIALPAELETISRFAFANCATLKTLAFADGAKLKTIEHFAFQGCSALESAVLPASTEKIWLGAFNDCKALQSARFEKGSALTEFGAEPEGPATSQYGRGSAFAGCELLAYAEIPEKVKDLPAHFFPGLALSELTVDSPDIIAGLNFADDLKRLFSKHEDDEGALERIAPAIFIPESEAEKLANGQIEKYGALLCEGLRMPESNKPGYAKYVPTGLRRKSMTFELYADPEDGAIAAAAARHETPNYYYVVDCTIPKEIHAHDATFPVRRMKEGMFEGNAMLGTVRFEQGCEITIIPENAFKNCSVKIADFLDSIEEIETGAFRSCLKLEEARIPESVAKIGDGAFEKCRALRTVRVDGAAVARDLAKTGLLEFCRDLYIADGLELDPRATLAGWALKPDAPGDAGCVEGYAHYVGGLVDIDGILYRLTPKNSQEASEAGMTIDYATVYGPADRENITEAVIPDEVTALGKKYAVTKASWSVDSKFFSNCKKLKTAHIPGAVAELPSSNDDDDGMEDYGDFLGAFYGCSALEKVTFGENSALTSIPHGAFEYCRALKEITIPASVAKIHNASFGYGVRSAFRGCEALAYVRFEKGSKVRDLGAFEELESIRNIDIPESLGSDDPDSPDWICPDELFAKMTKLETTTIESEKVIKALNDASSCGKLLSNSPIAYVPDGLIGLIAPTQGKHIWQNYVRIDSDKPGYAEYAPKKFMFEKAEYSIAKSDDSFFATLEHSAPLPGDCVVPAFAKILGRSFPVRKIADKAFHPQGTAYIEIISVSFDADSQVEEIGKSAFTDPYWLKSVALPASVKKIGESAFNGCEALESVTFAPGSKLEELGASAFYGCASLAEIALPAKLKSVPESAFANCAGLKSAAIPDSAEEIGDSAFEGCSSLVRIEIPAAVRTIGASAFRDCAKLESAAYAPGSKLEKIGACAFESCRALGEIFVPSRASSLGDDAFDGAAHCGAAVIAGDRIAAEQYGPSRLFDGINDLYLKTGVELDSAVATQFKRFIRLDPAKDPKARPGFAHYASGVALDGVRYGLRFDPVSNAREAFALEPLDFDAPRFRDLTVADKVECAGEEYAVIAIIEEAFAGDAGLKRLFVPKTVKYIDETAFEGCSNLEKVEFESGSTLESIGAGAFANCSALESIRFPASLTEMLEGAFWHCLALENIEFEPDCRLESVPEEAFACAAATKITLPASTKSVGERAFEGCASLESVEFEPNSAFESFGDNAFDGCRNLKRVDFPLRAKCDFASDLFKDCEIAQTIVDSRDVIRALTDDWTPGSNIDGNLIKEGSPISVYIPSGQVEKLCADYGSMLAPEGALDGSLVRLVDSDRPGRAQYVSRIAVNGDLVFAIDIRKTEDAEENVAVALGTRDDAVAELELPGVATAHGREFRVTEIWAEAFEGSVLTSFEFAEDCAVEKIGAGAFADCAGLKSVAIPATVKHIGDEAFGGCTALKTIRIDSADVAKKLNIESGLLDSAETAYAKTGLELDPALTGTLNFMKAARSDLAGYDLYGAKRIETPDGLVYALDEDASESGERLFFARLIEAKDDSVGEIALPSAVRALGRDFELREICEGAFCEFENLRKVVFARDSKLKAVPDFAFAGCVALESIALPDSIEEICEEAFEDCVELKTVAFGAGLKLISAWAFAGCEALREIDIPETVETVSKCAFADCSSLEAATLRSGPTIRALDSYGACGELLEFATRVYIPVAEADKLSSEPGAEYGPLLKDEFVETRRDAEGLAAFVPKWAMKDDLIYEILRDAGKSARAALIGPGEDFDRHAIFIPPTLEKYGLELPVTDVYGNAFRDNASLESVVFDRDSAVVRIGPNAFNGCANLEFAFLPASLEKIGMDAFAGCAVESTIVESQSVMRGLSDETSCGSLALNALRIYVPESATDLGELFGAAYARIDSDRPGYAEHFLKTFADDDGCFEIEYELSNAGATAKAARGDDVEICVPASICPHGREFAVAEIASNAYEFASDPAAPAESETESLFLPDSLRKIGKDAFKGRVKLCEIWFEGTMSEWKNIEKGEPFLDPACTANAVACLDGYVDIESPFEERPHTLGLEYAEKKDSAGTVVGYLVSGIGSAEGATQIVVPRFHDADTGLGELPIIGIADEAFAHNETIAEIALHDGIAEIGASAFEGCEKLTEIAIPDEIEAICDRAFAGCKALKSISGMSDATEIGASAFEGCESLKTIAIPDGVEKIGEKAFFGCKALESISGMIDATEIGASAFEGCEKLASVEIGVGAKSVGASAFKNCVALSDIVGGDNVARIGMAAFDGTKWLRATTPDFAIIGKALCKYRGDAPAGGILTVPDGIECIACGAFSQRSGLISVEIPADVKEIGEKAFFGCADLESVVGMASATAIGASAFEGCAKLGSITVPNGVAKIEEKTFFGCKALASATIGSGAAEIGASAFRECVALTSIAVPNSVKAIGERAFFGCKALESATGMSSATQIGASAFEGCVALTSAYVPNKVKAIGERAFFGCKALESATGMSSATQIGASAFEGCAKLGSITVPNGVATIEERTFFGCEALTSAAIGSGATEIGASAFEGCVALTSAYVPNKVKAIGERAFFGCKGLESIDGMNYATEIGASAFAGCVGLTTIKIPNGVESIDASAFDGCENISKVEFDGTMSEWAKIEKGENYIRKNQSVEWVFCDDGYVDIESPFEERPFTLGLEYAEKKDSAGTVVGYLVSGIGSAEGATRIVVPHFRDADTGLGEIPIVGIADEAFAHDETIAEIAVHAGIAEIGAGAFKDCAKLESIKLASNVARIGIGALDGAKWLSAHAPGFAIIGKALYKYISDESATVATIPEGIEQIAHGAFKGNATLTSITVPSSVESVGARAFFGCKALESITGMDGATEIGASAFEGCEKLTSITVPDGVSAIEERTFFGCESLASIDIGVGARSIGAAAFKNCAALSDIAGGDNVARIGIGAFDGAKWLSEHAPGFAIIGKALYKYISDESATVATIPDGIEQIAHGAFEGDATLTSITVPSSVKSVGARAFFGCKALESITGMDGATEIGASAFEGCEKLGSITVPDGVSAIEERTFFGCESLASIDIGVGARSIGAAAFKNCAALSDIAGGDNVARIGIGAFDGAKWLSEHAPGFAIIGKALYKYIPDESATVATIPDGIEQIAHGAFEGRATLTSITVPSSVKFVGARAFAGCKALESITGMDNATEIGASAFEGCEKLTSITVSDGISSIEERTFFGCEALESIFGLDNATEIGASAFEGCKRLSSIEIGYDVTNIGAKAFKGCVGLTTLTIPNGLEKIGANAFEGCAGLTELVFDGTTEDMCETIERSAGWSVGSEITVIACIDGDIPIDRQ